MFKARLLFGHKSERNMKYVWKAENCINRQVDYTQHYLFFIPN